MPENKVLIRRCIYFVFLMFAFSFALVPLYNVFCNVTGLNGKPEMQPADFIENQTSQSTLMINFLSHNQQHLPIQIQAQPAYLKIHKGKRYQQIYTVKNLSSQAITIQAIPSVSPGLAANHLHKIECFCFQDQHIPARESRELTLEFFVANNLPIEFEELYLSYAFFEKEINSNENSDSTQPQQVSALSEVEHEHEAAINSDMNLTSHKDH